MKNFNVGNVVRNKHPFFCEGAKVILTISERGEIRFCDYLEHKQKKITLIENSDKEDFNKNFNKIKTNSFIEILRRKGRQKKYKLIKFLEDF